ncbi:MAG: hopanoid-associated sugar epimerase [Terriglobales bacterium]
MLVFVTGATGFVGSHVARALAEAGADLRLLVRPTSRTENIESLKEERVTGDLREPAFLKKAMSGCEAVFHVAADYRIWCRDPQEMYRSNVDGTRALIEAAAAAGVRRVVYTSSVATMGFTRNGSPADENSPVSLADMIGPYKRSKFMAEQVALQAPHVVVVNPTTPVGEQDIKPTPTGQVIVSFLRRKFPAYVDTGLNLVDVRECARGHLQALEKGRPGQRYVLGGENLTLKQILDRLAAITGLPAPNVRLPYAVALCAGAVDTAITGHLLRREPRVVLDAVRMGRKKMFANSAKAERELGFKVTGVDEALRRAVDWFRAHGYAS